MNMRINKLLSETGLGSRREVETLIVEGRVTVNGVLAELTDVIEEDDVVTLDGEELPVCDLIREFAAEQKMQLVQKNSGRIGSQYIESEEEGGGAEKAGSFRSQALIQSGSHRSLFLQTLCRKACQIQKTLGRGRPRELYPRQTYLQQTSAVEW